MSNLIPIQGSLGLAHQDRALTRQLTQLDRGKQAGLARLEATAQLEAGRVHAVGYVGQQAMQAVTMVSQLEGQLGMLCPLAVSRLQGIADITSAAIAQVVFDAARRLT